MKKQHASGSDPTAPFQCFRMSKIHCLPTARPTALPAAADANSLTAALAVPASRLSRLLGSLCLASL
jgi:hypothetical protein